MDKKILSVVMLFLFTVPIAFAGTVTIGVQPSEVVLDFYKSDVINVKFSFFNDKGDSGVYYVISPDDCLKNILSLYNSRVYVPNGTTRSNPVITYMTFKPDLTGNKTCYLRISVDISDKENINIKPEVAVKVIVLQKKVSSTQTGTFVKSTTNTSVKNQTQQNQTQQNQTLISENRENPHQEINQTQTEEREKPMGMDFLRIAVIIITAILITIILGAAIMFKIPLFVIIPILAIPVAFGEDISVMVEVIPHIPRLYELGIGGYLGGLVFLITLVAIPFFFFRNIYDLEINIGNIVKFFLIMAVLILFLKVLPFLIGVI